MKGTEGYLIWVVFLDADLTDLDRYSSTESNRMWNEIKIIFCCSPHPTVLSNFSFMSNYGNVNAKTIYCKE